MKLRECELKLVDDGRLSNDKIIEQAKDALTMPSDSMWHDDELFSTHTMMFATPDIKLTDEYLMGWSNYIKILEGLAEHYPNDVSAETFGHWTYSTFACIKVRVLDDDGYITAAFIEAVEIEEWLTSVYPAWDEDHWVSLENDAEEEHVAMFAKYNGITMDALSHVMHENECYYHLNEGWDMPEDELLALVREREQELAATPI
jgi:hypothetical protein